MFNTIALKEGRTIVRYYSNFRLHPEGRLVMITGFNPAPRNLLAVTFFEIKKGPASPKVVLVKPSGEVWGSKGYFGVASPEDMKSFDHPEFRVHRQVEYFYDRVKHRLRPKEDGQ